MRVAEAEHRALHPDPRGYCAHPHLARCGGELVAVFNRAPRRGIVLHPPQDPLYLNLLTRSTDEGLTWSVSVPVPVPGHSWSGVECAGLTDLGGGRLMLNQWRFDWRPLPEARHLPDRSGWAFPEELAAGLKASPELDGMLAGSPETVMPWARGPGRAFVHLSEDGGATWATTVELGTAPFRGGYGMRGAVRPGDGALLLLLGDVPAYARVYALRSDDEGRSWSAPVRVAAQPGRLFEEPAPLALPSGRVLVLLRENVGRALFQAHSDDGGLSWSPPEPTGIAGYPAHLTRLADGRLLCTYGLRRPPHGIYAVLSEDDGRTWLAGSPLAIRTNLPGKDLGYPCTLQLKGGGLLSLYYARGPEGITALRLTRWRLAG